MVINPEVLRSLALGTYALRSDAKSEEKTNPEASLDQIKADLRALHEVSPKLYDQAVKYMLGSATSKLHKVTKAAIKLAFDIGHDGFD